MTMRKISKIIIEPDVMNKVTWFATVQLNGMPLVELLAFLRVLNELLEDIKTK